MFVSLQPSLSLVRIELSLYRLMVTFQVDKNLVSWLKHINLRIEASSADISARLIGSEFKGRKLSIIKIGAKGASRILALNPDTSFSFAIADGGVFKGVAGDRDVFATPNRFSFMALPGEPVKIHPGADLISGYIFQISADYLLSEAVEHGTQLPSLVTLQETIPGHEQLILACANQLIKFSALADELSSLRIMQPLEESIVSLLATLVGVDPSALNPGKQNNSKPSYVQIALSYMENNLNQPINLSDLCIACNVSCRTLQVSFQTVMSSTPLQVLQELRFTRLRDLLLQGMDVGRACETVGLQHSGRISAKYKQMYGELPSHTRSRRL